MDGVLFEVVRIDGELSTNGVITGDISCEDSLTGSIAPIASIEGEILPGMGVYDVFDGDYEVDPAFSSKVLDTDGKLMSDDVTVKPIYVSVTENLSGGNTVYIGGELNG